MGIFKKISDKINNDMNILNLIKMEIKKIYKNIKFGKIIDVLEESPLESSDKVINNNRDILKNKKKK